MNTIIRRIVHLLGCSLVYLLTIMSTGNAQVTITPSHLPLDQLNVGDIDFQTGGSRSWFFTLSIGDTRPEGEDVVLKFSTDIQLSDQNFPNAISFKTDKFHIPRTVTNLNIGSNSDIKMAPGTSAEFTPEAKTRIENELLATGKLPAGTYTFNLEVLDSTGQSFVTPVQTQLVLTLRNISRLDLITPRDNDVVPNPYPLFQWIYDGTRVELAVYERFPRHSSKEEATEGTPHLAVTLDNVRSFQYPSSGARPLEPDHTYVWKLRGLTTGSGGVGSSINSEIWQFSVASSGGMGNGLTGGGGGGTQGVVNQLQNLPGISSQLLSQLSGGDLQPTGTLLVDGVPMSLGEFTALLNDLAQNPDRIISIQIIDRP